MVRWRCSAKSAETQSSSSAATSRVDNYTCPVPALLAKAAALNRGDKIWEADIDGSLWSQQTFAYQGKCLEWIKGEFKVLSQSDQESVNKLLAGTGCEALLI